ncbi:FMN-binding glutamate synthase family protein [Synechococcus sp. CBW1107]|uniref:FMN-binding glutamate synthase family protein n=1 Tax=Synechococcus sp. CBW1107 TaxID=2789857 RepID=UPI002AD56C61|nr:FMN-binding glutamate synthase family protein [Synechococcus sp. CBW1107]
MGALGPVVSMGLPRSQLPLWDDIQILTAQLARRPLAESAPVGTELVIGPRARRPLRLEIPLLVSDMSFGTLSEEAKRALATGAERAGTGICSGEGGMLSEEQAANQRYLYELAPAMFGYREDLLPRVQAFHFKAAQAAKTGAGGHLPGAKVTAHIARVRGIPEGQPADCIKAPALGADGIALASAAIQVIGCVGSRICHTHRCPTGVATQDPELRRRLQVEPAGQRLDRFFRATVALMQVMARACGHDHLNPMSRHRLERSGGSDATMRPAAGRADRGCGVLQH